MTFSVLEREAMDRATEVRSAHGYGPTAPVSQVQELIEQVSPAALVAIIDMPKGLDGMVVKDPKTGRVVVGIATTSIPERQRSSLAHELGHIVFEDYNDGATGDCAARTSEERRADMFARHLLAPLQGVQDLLADHGIPQRKPEQGDLALVTRHFGVSPDIARFQLERLELIDAATSSAWESLTGSGLAAASGHLRAYQADAARSQEPIPPQNLVERATRAYTRNQLSIDALAGLSDIDPKVLLAELSVENVVPAEVPDLSVSDDDFFGHS